MRLVQWFGAGVAPGNSGPGRRRGPGLSKRRIPGSPQQPRLPRL